MATKDPGGISNRESGQQEQREGSGLRSRNRGSSSANAAGPHDRAGLATEATEGTGMLPNPGEASDEDMAPGG
jgi:hypothetical protein